ncbi:MAG: hypothetical protein AAGI92_00140 [Pseudomonadota bacterium]
MGEAIRAQFAAAKLPWQFSAIGSVIWAFLIGATTYIDARYFSGYALQRQLELIALFFALGAAISFPLALFIARFLRKTPGKLRFIIIASSIAVCTLLATAIVLALEFRGYFVQWHAPFGTRLWLWQQFFTTAGAVYQYLVIGIRLYFPLGLIALFVVSLWANRLDN